MTDRSGLCIAFHGFGRPGEEIAEQEDDGQTDIAALRAGTISITPITVFNQKDTMSEPHSEFFQRLLERSGGG